MGDTSETQGGSELLLRVSAAGGSVTLYGRPTASGWQFSRNVTDLTSTLINEPHIAHASTIATSWTDALKLLDQYRWHKLSPSFVYPEFRVVTWQAVEARFKSEGGWNVERIGEWREACDIKSADTARANEYKAFTLVELQQGTPEWLDWRSQGIGASDAPTIMGENPWKSAAQLLDEKCGTKNTDSSNAMARGSALEPEARTRFEQKFVVQVAPACLQSVEIEWLRASVDGITSDFSRVVEIKCGESVYRKTSISRQVPRYYFGQLQHILAVTNLDAIDFWCYSPNKPELHLVVLRDDGYINRMFKVEFLFWRELARRKTSA